MSNVPRDRQPVKCILAKQRTTWGQQLTRQQAQMRLTDVWCPACKTWHKVLKKKR